jgi:hypothetical protein
MKLSMDAAEAKHFAYTEALAAQLKEVLYMMMVLFLGVLMICQMIVGASRFALCVVWVVVRGMWGWRRWCFSRMECTSSQLTHVASLGTPFGRRGF